MNDWVSQLESVCKPADNMLRDGEETVEQVARKISRSYPRTGAILRQAERDGLVQRRLVVIGGKQMWAYKPVKKKARI